MVAMAGGGIRCKAKIPLYKHVIPPMVLPQWSFLHKLLMAVGKRVPRSSHGGSI